MKIVVLAGGPSREREVSLNSGRAIAEALVELNHEVSWLDLRDSRELIFSDTPTVFSEQESAPASAPPVPPASLSDVRKADFVFNALHGGIGENGKIQALLDLIGVSYNGSGVLASALAMDKFRTKTIVAAAGVTVAPTIFFGDETAAFKFCGSRAMEHTKFPLVVKPNAEGSTIGLSIAKTYQELLDAIRKAAQHDRFLLIEPYLAGREITVSLLNGEPLPIVEIIPKSGLYDYDAKYSPGASEYICPAQLPRDLAHLTSQNAVNVWEMVGCRGYARADFRLGLDNQPYLLEINTLPGMTSTSLVPKAAKAAGISFTQLVERIVELGQLA